MVDFFDDDLADDDVKLAVDAVESESLPRGLSTLSVLFLRDLVASRGELGGSTPLALRLSLLLSELPGESAGVAARSGGSGRYV